MSGQAMSADHPERFAFQQRTTINRDTFKPEHAMWIVFDRFNKTAAHFHGRLSETRREHSDAYQTLRVGQFKGLWFDPTGIELHYPTPRYEGQQPYKNCGVSGGDCYIDGTSLGADRFARYWDGDDKSAFLEVKAWLTRDEVSP